VFLIKHYSGPAPINVGVGEDLTIAELARTVQEIVGYEGQIVYDSSNDGTPRKLIDVSRLHALGWKAQMPFRDGLERAYADFLTRAGHGQKQRLERIAS